MRSIIVYFFFVSIFSISTCTVYLIGLDHTSKSPNLNFTNSRDRYYDNLERELLKNSNEKEVNFSDVVNFSDSIMFANGFKKLNGDYYLNGERKYFDEIMDYSNFVK